MKVLGLSAGTKDGCNDSLVKEALMGAKEVGADIEFIHLLDLNIKHCIGCIHCCMSLFAGKGGGCVLKDDFDWLLDKILDADGVVLSSPIFEKGAAGISRTICDRFGPRVERANNIMGTKISKEKGGLPPDPRLLNDKVISFMAVGGTQWGTRVELDHAMIACMPVWKIIENIRFEWAKNIIVDDEKIAIAHTLGRNLAEAAKDIANAKYVGEPGVCPHCHSKEFYLVPDSTCAICNHCGIEGELSVENGKYVFKFDDSWLEKAHDTVSGKYIHFDDVTRVEYELLEVMKTDKYKERVKKYKEFITATKPIGIK